jgi:hypothetical protein
MKDSPKRIWVTGIEKEKLKEFEDAGYPHAIYWH